MTGYGMGKTEQKGLSISVEIKTLNSRNLDANVRLPRIFSEKELEIRNKLNEVLERGKVNVNVDFNDNRESKPKVKINRTIVKAYYEDLFNTAKKVGANSDRLFDIAINMPQATESVDDESDYEKEWKLVLKTLNTALTACDDFRKKEGDKLAKKISGNANNIRKHLKAIEKYDPQRVKAIRQRLEKSMEDLKKDMEIDNNRFEQELVYYIEKLDINEEKVRLKSHLDYFDEVMKNKQANGKKLGFIAQEIGREINTIGSKANDSDVQRHVVDMKEDLEMIKEQLMNIL